jgi:CRP-like cAMP-binding protein
MTHQAKELDQELAAVPILSGLSRRQRARLLDRSRIVDHAAGHEVAHEGAGALALHVVIDGEASVTVHGREVRRLGPGSYFGEISMIDGRPRSATVVALTDRMRTLSVPHHAFQEVLLDEPECVHQLLVTLCARLREAEAAAMTG